MSELESSVEEILDRLRGDSGRATAGRRVIVRALLTADDHHVTAEDLAAAVQAEHPNVHLSTVYRTLDALVVAGVVDRIQLGAGTSVYHRSDHAHHHLVCTRCGTVEELPADFVAPLTADIESRFGWQRPRMVISGRCARCEQAAAER